MAQMGCLLPQLSELARQLGRNQLGARRRAGWLREKEPRWFPSRPFGRKETSAHLRTCRNAASSTRKQPVSINSSARYYGPWVGTAFRPMSLRTLSYVVTRGSLRPVASALEVLPDPVQLDPKASVHRWEPEQH